MHTTYYPTHTNSMSAISQLLLTRFWQNFKVRPLGPSWTDLNCHRDICPGNICHGDIFLCQEYRSCYWSDFDQTLKVDSWDYLELIPTVMETFGQDYLGPYWPNFDQTLKIGSWDNLEPISTVMATFVQATIILATFVHIRIISAVTDQILTKL